MTSQWYRAVSLLLLSKAIICSAFITPPHSRTQQSLTINTDISGIISSAVSVDKSTSATTTAGDDSDNEKEEEENPRLSGLALMLDDGTRKSHSVAQNSAFVTGFFKGLSTRDAYRQLITSLYFVYKEMEDVFDKTIDEDVLALDDERLRRIKALEDDMEYFYGNDWKQVIKPSLATQTYVSRIQEVAEKEPYLLIAHQYTRYLGDLFGGQMMGGMATRSLDLEDGKGIAFYTFENISNNNKFIAEWYKKLNLLKLSNNQKEEIVNEANYVFDLNIGILEELDGSPLKAIWTLAINSLKQKIGF